MDLLARVAPFFGVVALGALLGRTGVLSARVGGWLAAYTYWFGFPVLLLHWLWSPAEPTGLALPAGVYGTVMLAVLALAGVTWSRGRPAEVGAGVAMSSAVGNTTYLGGPLVVSALGEAAKPVAAAFMAVDWLGLTGLAVLMLQRARPGGRRLRGLVLAVVNPTVLGAGAGLTLWLLRTPRPPAVDAPIGWIAAVTAPLALLALGGVMGRSFERPSSSERGQLLTILLLKLLAAPLLVWLGFTALGLDGLVRSAAVVMAGCPTALNVFVQARAAGVYERGAVLAVVWSTAAGVLTLTLLLAFRI
jgi:predicted permease